MEPLWDGYPNGKETTTFFEAWPEIARLPNIRPCTAKHKSVADMWAPLEAVHGTH